MVGTGTEMTAFMGEYLPGSVWEKHFKYPYYPGYNNIGTVVETGNGTDQELLGKKFATWGNHAAYSVQKVINLYPVEMFFDLVADGKIEVERTISRKDDRQPSPRQTQAA